MLRRMQGRSIRQIVWARLRRDRVAMTCLVLLITFYLLAIVGPFVLTAAGYSQYTFDRSAMGRSSPSVASASPRTLSGSNGAPGATS
jgi:ABC-type antimicrobial peptide transport system permease subunit